MTSANSSSDSKRQLDVWYSGTADGVWTASGAAARWIARVAKPARSSADGEGMAVLDHTERDRCPGSGDRGRPALGAGGKRPVPPAHLASVTDDRQPEVDGGPVGVGHGAD